MTRKTHGHKTGAPPDIEETRDHIIAAGRELLLAAHGALHFCKDYVEKTVPDERRPALLGFFKKAISVADELGNSISGVSSLKRAAEGFVKPVFEAMEKEMRSERTCCREKRAPSKKRAGKKRGERQTLNPKL